MATSLTDFNITVRFNSLKGSTLAAVCYDLGEPAEDMAGTFIPHSGFHRHDVSAYYNDSLLTRFQAALEERELPVPDSLADDIDNPYSRLRNMMMKFVREDTTIITILQLLRDYTGYLNFGSKKLSLLKIYA